MPFGKFKFSFKKKKILLQIEDEVDEINAKVFSELERKLQD